MKNGHTFFSLIWIQNLNKQYRPIDTYIQCKSLDGMNALVCTSKLPFGLRKSLSFFVAFLRYHMRTWAHITLPNFIADEHSSPNK